MTKLFSTFYVFISIKHLNHRATTHLGNKANINTLDIQTPCMKFRNIIQWQPLLDQIKSGLLANMNNSTTNQHRAWNTTKQLANN